MYTLADISLMVARAVTPENIADGEVTASTTTSITDTNNLIQPNEYFNKGTLWILSGILAGRVIPVSSHSGNKLNWVTALPSAPVAGVRFAVARNIYPWQQIRSAIQSALDETHVEAVDSTLVGDGDTLAFTLPTGVWDVKRVYFKDNYRPTEEIICNHWREQVGKLKFDYGYAPNDGYIINIVYRDQHPQLLTYSTDINAEININWLKWKAVENLLLWGMGAYGNQVEYRIEERINKAMTELKRLTPRSGAPDLIVKTAGA